MTILEIRATSMSVPNVFGQGKGSGISVSSSPDNTITAGLEEHVLDELAVGLK